MPNDTLTFRHYREYDVAVKVWLYFPPILIVIGTVANAMSIVVLLRKSMRTSNTMLYLLVLSVGDLFVLYTGLLRYWIKYGFHHDIRLISNFLCKFHVFLVYVSLDFTAWILVAVTIDRCILIRHPFKAKSICTRTVAKATVCAILGTLIIFNGHMFWSLQIVDMADEIQCIYVTYFGTAIWPWMDFSIFSVIPFITMTIANIVIVRRLCRSSRRLHAHTLSERLRNNSERSENTTAKSDSTRQQNGTGSGRCRVPIRQALGTIPSVTLMLLSVNCLFLVLTVPIVIFNLGFQDWYMDASDHARAWMQLVWAVCNMLQYLNNTIHFFIYCLAGPKFRREFKSLFTKVNKVANIAEPSATVELY